MVRTIASALPYVASALVLGAVVPACSSGGNNTSGFQTAGNGNKNGNGGGGSGDNGGGITGGGGDNGGGLNLQDGGSGSFLDAGCAQATATATRQPVYLLFVLDGSGSMQQDNKWTAAVGALDSIFDDMKTKADPGVAVGLIAFSDTNDPTGGGGPYPSSADVGIAIVDQAHHDALRGRIDNSSYLGGTPTGKALTGGYGELSSFKPSGPLAPGGKKVLVIMTDGVPELDTCDISGSNYAGNPCVTMAANQLKAAAPQGPIETFVIGVGVFPSGDLTNYDPNFLGYLAQAGGGAPAGCSPSNNTSTTGLCYFNVDPSGASSATQTAFENAINAIRGQVASCTYPLQATDAGTIDPSKVNVTVNGQGILQDPGNGWSYSDPSDTTIQLNGSACDTVKNTPGATVSIILGCATAVAK